MCHKLVRVLLTWWGCFGLMEAKQRSGHCNARDEPLPPVPHPRADEAQGKRAFQPLFWIETTVSLPDVKVREAVKTLLDPDHIETLTRLSPTCISWEKLPSNGPSSAAGGVDRFKVVERVPTLSNVWSVQETFGQSNVAVDTAQRRVHPMELLQESLSVGLHMRKRRSVRLDSSICGVRVEERIEGSCPAALHAVTLREVAKTHAEHMELYHRLFLHMSKPKPTLSQSSTDTSTATTTGTPAAPGTHAAELDTRAKAERVFRYLDADGSGTLHLGELLRLAKSDKAAFEDLPQIFTFLDMEGFARGDGSITLEEWMVAAEQMPQLSDDAFAQSLSVMMERAVGLASQATLAQPEFIQADGSVDRDALLAATFRRLDVSADGRLDVCEYLQGATNQVNDGPPSAAPPSASDEELDEAGREFVEWDMFSEMDGKLSLADFKHGVLGKYARSSDDEFVLVCKRLELHLRKPIDVAERTRKLVELFNLLDADGSGYVTVGEVLRLAKNGSDTDREALPLFCEHLDGRAGDGSSGSTDGKLVLDEWTSGLLESMAQRTHEEFSAFCDGMRTSLRLPTLPAHPVPEVTL